MSSRVSIVKGLDRRENVRHSLEKIRKDILADLGERQVVVKPNFVSPSIRLAVTHADHVRGILDFFGEVIPGKQILIAESAPGDTQKAFRHFGYDQLVKEYPVELIDLNKGPFQTIPIKDREGRPLDVRVSSLLLDRAYYLVSAARLKTHDVVVVTLSIKNLAIGGIIAEDKRKVHQGIARTHRNIADLAVRIWPDLSVIDGYEGMQGDGPAFGDPIHVGLAIAGTDALAADRVACDVMGVDFQKVGYLSLCREMRSGTADLKDIEIVGSPLDECITPFKLHHGVEEQYRW